MLVAGRWQQCPQQPGARWQLGAVARWSCTQASAAAPQEAGPGGQLEGTYLCTSLLLKGSNPPAPCHPGWSKQRAENPPLLLRTWGSSLHCHFLMEGLCLLIPARQGMTASTGPLSLQIQKESCSVAYRLLTREHQNLFKF